MEIGKLMLLLRDANNEIGGLRATLEAWQERAEKAEARGGELTEEIMALRQQLKMRPTVADASILLNNRRAAEAKVAKMRAALPDADKLDILADWLELDDVQRRREIGIESAGEGEVQTDLRRWARQAREVIAEVEVEET